MKKETMTTRPRMTPRLAFLVEYLNLPAATNDPNAKWELFQLQQLNYDGVFDIWLKSRQVGFSWTSAAEAVAQCILVPRSTILFVSINQNEAKEKIRYAKQVIDSLDPSVRPTGLIVDNAQELELANGSRLISHPATPARGKAKAWVYLDEFAHIPKDRLIYEAAVPVTTRGGRIRIGSSPLGELGVFWEIFAQRLQKYPTYKRFRIPWWHISALCKDVHGAKQAEGTLNNVEMVEAFASQSLKVIFEAMPLESFEQEYCCAWVDEAVSWITWDEIRRNQVLDSTNQTLYYTAENPTEAMTYIDQLGYDYRRGRFKGDLNGGFDVGRKRNRSELVFVGKDGDRFPYRLGISLDRLEFRQQEDIVGHAMRTLPVDSLLVDEMGLGMQLAENLAKTFPGRVEQVTFSLQNKTDWATNTKVLFQDHKTPIPTDRDLAYQIHSIRRRVTSASKMIFDPGNEKDHHADKFWALSLALWAASEGGAGQTFIY